VLSLRKKKKKEEYSSGKTADLRNVIAEIQKVDQETADLSGVVEEVQRIERKTERSNSIYTCRLLFSSILDKILLFVLLLSFLYISYLNFKGNILGAAYGFWFRVLRELGIGVLLLFGYGICNWIYNCYARTMLCLTSNSIYREIYFPFFRKETTIPLEHVTSIATVDFFWIFRSIVIFQYHHMPIIFFTWNNQRFKNKADEVMGCNTVTINSFQNRGILQKTMLPVIQWIFILFVMAIIVLGIFHFFGYIFSEEKKLSGTYLKGTQKIELYTDGTCNLRMSHIKDLKKCTWTIHSEEKTIDIEYEYRKSNYFGEAYKTHDVMSVGYDQEQLIYNGKEYKKK